MKAVFPYRYLRRQQGLSVATAWVVASCTLLAWCCLRLESPAWQRVLQRKSYWFPQINSERSRGLDPLRYVMQTFYLLMVQDAFKGWRYQVRRAWLAGRLRLQQALSSGRGFLQTRLGLKSASAALEVAPVQAGASWYLSLSLRQQRWLSWVLLGVALVLLLFSITQPLHPVAHLIFILVLWLIALAIRDIPGRFITLAMLVMTALIASRYLWWRYTATLKWDSALDLTFGLLLLAAETYAWLVLMLGYVQTSWPLQRKPARLPADVQLWPNVDVYIPTYNEPLPVVRTTLLAAQGLDWPQDKLNIYLLDDGKRAEFKHFAAEIGVGYITRPDNSYAKAGNLNHAMQQTSGEFIAIFDCDHIPVRSFLQLTLGWLVQDSKMALVQTPHHFLSPDPFERNLNLFRKRPNEGELFYGLVQAGNDTWNAAFFCGSCAVLRRSALESIGGFAVETVTEDAHTALRMHRQGWKSAYLGVPQAAGLATESLSSHIAQRIRWARGMVQIFRTDNPLLGKGLNLLQRLCYLNAMLHFLAGLPRIIFLLAPLAYLIFHAYIIYAPALMILLHVLPYMAHTALTGARLQGKHRGSFWSEVYETALAWHIARPTTVALFNPKKGKFNVTEKGGLMASDQFDWNIAKPYLLLAGLNLIGLGMAGYRLLYGPPAEIGTVIITSIWVLYNLLIIGAAVAVAAEVRQVRHSNRVEFKLPAILLVQGGFRYPATLRDYSDAGAGLELEQPLALASDAQVQLVLKRGTQEYSFPAQVRRSCGQDLGLSFSDLTQQQKIDLVQCTYARADAWLNWQHKTDTLGKPLQGLWEVLRTGMQGYQRLYAFLPTWLTRLLWPVTISIKLLAALLPQAPGSKATTSFSFVRSK